MPVEVGVALLPGALDVQVSAGYAFVASDAADLIVVSLADPKTPRRVESVEFTKDILDVMLLLDTSLVGEMVQPMADDLIAQLEPKEQMAVVSFHSAADLIQDFTSSKELLLRSIAKVKYGNSPRVLDALYATVDGGFQGSSFRRVVLLLTTGVEGSSRVDERQVIKLARRSGVSIFPVYLMGYERSMFEKLAQQTGGALFNVRDLQKNAKGQQAARIFEVLRSHYVVSISGNLSLGERIKVEVNRPGKFFTSALPLE
jgi:uncharacterized protein YegL